MMWNSRAEIRAAARALAVLLIAAPAGACVAPPATDAPAPAIISAPVAPALARAEVTSERIRLARVEIAPVEANESIVRRIVHPDDLAGLRDPVLITVHLVRPLGDLSRTASPVVVLNGEPLTNSMVTGERYDRVLAVFPSRDALKRVNLVQVGWFGDLKATLSEPLEVILAQ